MDHKFFNNKECEYFPCHKRIDANDFDDIFDFNCLFCYCPLYHDDDCGGNYKHLDDYGTEYSLEELREDGIHYIKDCSDCTIPHIKDIGYKHIQDKMTMKIIKQGK